MHHIIRHLKIRQGKYSLQAIEFCCMLSRYKCVEKCKTPSALPLTMNVYPKTDIRYWRGKVVFQTPASRTYSVQLQYAGRRAYVGLKTANKEEAATLARKFYEALRANGWDAALAGLQGARSHPREEGQRDGRRIHRGRGCKGPFFAEDA
jgi:hypothetical protein